MTAKNLHRMNSQALAYVSEALDGIGKGGKAFESPNFFIWVRDLMTVATTQALDGPDNPFRNDAGLMEDTWTFEADLPVLMLSVAPSITARKCYAARARLQAALCKHYGNDGDFHQDAAQVTKNRANILRRHGIPDEDVGTFELALLHVSTSNTIPTLFWFIVHIFSRPELVTRLREDLLPLAQRGSSDEVTIDIAALDDHCPLLVRCYRASTRLANKGMGNRRVMEDTTISDDNGRSYLLKKGYNLQVSSQVSHSLAAVWGTDAESFNPDRFIVETGKENAEAEKMKRLSYMPFGGGRHLCPGRNFAFAENLGFVASLLLGFDVEPLDASMKQTYKIPDMAECLMTGAVAKPVDGGEGYGIRIRRREGWEGVRWRYTS